MAYTTIAEWSGAFPRSQRWVARIADGALEIVYRDGKWHGLWVGGHWIAIPGARNLQVAECVAGWTTRRRKLGKDYVLVPRDLSDRLPPLGEWCVAYADLSFGDQTAYWIEGSIWSHERRTELPMPFIPELDEPAHDLRRVALSERRYREAKAALAEAGDERRAAIAAAVPRRSRRRVASATGLSFARVQQLIG